MAVKAATIEFINLKIEFIRSKKLIAITFGTTYGRARSASQHTLWHSTKGAIPSTEKTPQN
jgi:hypothetical protein